MAFCARSLQPAELNYHTTDQDLLGGIHALKQWRCFMKGSPRRTSHESQIITPLSMCKTKQICHGDELGGLSTCNDSRLPGNTGLVG